MGWCGRWFRQTETWWYIFCISRYTTITITLSDKGWQNNPHHPVIYSYLIPYVLLQVYDDRFPVHRCQQYSIKGVL